MAHVMMTLQRPGGRPTIEQVKNELGLTSEQIDTDFGVVVIDPRDNTYAVRVDETSAAANRPNAADDPTQEKPSQEPQAQPGKAKAVKGPYSDPKIEPMGLYPN